ncbi:ATPase, T2SS/T4P/T4SS family [Proteinivorax tanatarense]|uniref:ATPase, T2SS/T4P/T4SS family n=1 Tax=Proteinivorax tanatarense TaxID=1260629 RepID=A0AAU7VPY0_9FIRM
MNSKLRLGDLLVDTGKITQEQLTQALTYQKQKDVRLGSALVELEILTENELIEVLEFQLGIPHISLYKYPVDEKVINIINSSMAKNFSAIPIRLQDNRLTLAMADPLDVVAIDEISDSTGYEVDPVIATPDEIKQAIDNHYGIKETVDKAMENLKSQQQNVSDDMLEIDTLKDMVDDAPIVRAVNSILEQAVTEGASDIHIEPREDNLQVRFRIDGVLHDIMTSAKNTQAVIISRLKIMANMDIAERRLPQDNRFQTEIKGKQIDIRVSTLPTIYGEKIALRILDTDSLILDINNLGMSAPNLNKFKKVLNYSTGIFLVTGPTGCGKTTTLYSILNQINSSDQNIITIEDPVEYRLDGINQVNVNTKIGLDFARGLRSVLRQDPNVIMVGEIRDKETGEIALRAAMTGHLVLSTLHTNDAVSTLNRLADMGLPPFLISSTINGVLAQRLVRKLCQQCEGIGCKQCNETGYKGRVAIQEMLVMDDSLREALQNNASTSKLKEIALQNGLITLYNDGMDKVSQGLTSKEEVLRVAYGEGVN